jgi:hypothetical protein
LVRTIKRDYFAMMPKPDTVTAIRNLATAFEHYNPRSLAGNPPQRYIDLASLTEAVPGIHCAGGEEIPPT